MTTLRRIIVALAILTTMVTLFTPSKPAQAAGICVSVFNSTFDSILPVTGAWGNNDLATRGITRVGIDCTPAPTGGEIWTMHVFGKCHPTDCDWGVVRATPIGSSYVSAFYNQGFAWRYITAWRVDYYTVQVHLSTTFTDFRRPRYTWDGNFSRIIGGLGNCPNPSGDLSNGC